MQTMSSKLEPEEGHTHGRSDADNIQGKGEHDVSIRTKQLPTMGEHGLQPQPKGQDKMPGCR